jgi:DHA2 family multidrug resistance protein-like MFS transporter
LPHVTSALTPTADQALWILDIYGFVVGSLLITFGNIGNRYGRLKLILIGAVIFGAGSLGAAWSQSPLMLIATRLLMGLGGATLLPSGLAIASALFPDPRMRARHRHLCRDLRGRLCHWPDQANRKAARP